MRLALLALLVLAACNEPAPTPAPPAPAPVHPTPAPEQNIYLDDVTPGNPVLVKGRARTFENAVSIRARDANGAVIAEEHVTSVGEMGQHNPFTAEVWLVRDPGSRITIEALEYSAKDGSEQSLVSRTIAQHLDPIAVKLVFPLQDCTRFADFTRRVPKSVAMARLLVEALLAGPIDAEKSAGASSPFPQGSNVRSVVLRNGELTVDFNERLQNVGGSCAALAIRESVTRTLTQLPTVKRVVITAAGSRDLALQP